jgi:hypothetical protein
MLLDDRQPDRLPHCWAVTSDSLAARVAGVAGARLILLKSVSLPDGSAWQEAARCGIVDEGFPTLVGSLRAVQTVNFREWQR